MENEKEEFNQRSLEEEINRMEVKKRELEQILGDRYHSGHSKQLARKALTKIRIERGVLMFYHFVLKMSDSLRKLYKEAYEKLTNKNKSYRKPPPEDDFFEP